MTAELTARDRVILETMKWAYDLARRCGETAEQAKDEGIDAAEFVKRMMPLERVPCATPTA